MVKDFACSRGGLLTDHLNICFVDSRHIRWGKFTPRASRYILWSGPTQAPNTLNFP